MFVGVVHKGNEVIEEKLDNNELFVKIKGNDNWFKYSQFLDGCVSSKHSKHIGTVVPTKYGNLTILSVNFDGVAEVRLDNGYTTHCKVHRALYGGVKNFTFPIIYGKGYLGDGDFKIKDYKVEYSAWVAMLGRINENNSVSVHECKWHVDERKKRKVQNTKLVVDKDISGELLYSANTSFLVSPAINNSFTSHKMQKIIPLPVGVTRVKHDKYKVVIYNNLKKEVIGVFDNPIEASNAHTKRKAELRIELANEYMDELCERGYSAIIKQSELTIKTLT